MHVAGPIHTKDEARAFEQVAFLEDLRRRLASRRRGVRSPMLPLRFGPDGGE